MSTGKKVALGVLGLFVACILVVLVLAAGKPDIIHVERTVVIEATPAQVFPHANDLTKYVKWMPWSELDPNQTTEFSDPPAGAGAWYTWSGNNDVGAGRMEIISSTPESVVYQVHFIEPFESEAKSTLTLEPSGADQTKVMWSFDQPVDFGTKVMCVFMDFDKMLGGDFEKGLGKMKQLVEAEAPQS
jgi:uncharacterized protein YndB with AHSA1/START domain